MKHHRRTARPASSSGQATVEFLVALLVMVPLFFGVYYFARYSDVKHSAIQASRYVAFERTMDPNQRAKTEAQLAAETRARFFMPITTNNGVITYHQTTNGANADSGRVPLWSNAEYQPLLQNFNDVGIREVSAGGLNSGASVGNLHTKVGKLFGLPTGGVTRAEVTVPLNNVAHFDVLSNINIGMPGATAIGTGMWNASGARDGPEDVCGRVKKTVIGGYIEPVMDILAVVMKPFEKDTPDVGLILPDYVPPGSVRNGNTDVAYPAQDGNKC